MFLSNTENTIEFGKEVTDTIANWVTKEICSRAVFRATF
jgi:hypothetical protein